MNDDTPSVTAAGAETPRWAVILAVALLVLSAVLQSISSPV